MNSVGYLGRFELKNLLDVDGLAVKTHPKCRGLIELYSS